MNIFKRIIRRTKWEIYKFNSQKRNTDILKRHCNICGADFKEPFHPIPLMYMENAKRTGFPYVFADSETLNYLEYNCPFCRSTDRDRLYALYLSKTLQHSMKYDLLDIAPNTALQQFLKKISNINYRSADLYADNVDDQIDLMDMHIYPDKKFDIFICSHVLEHVMDDRKAMQELYRVLKPGGFGIAMVPIILPLKEIDEDTSITDPDERWRRFGQNDHLRLYSRNEFIQRLVEAGFNVEQITLKHFGTKQFLLNGISPKSVLYIVHK